MPCTPIAESASRTSSSLNGLMIAVTSFMRVSIGRRLRAARLASEGFADRKHDRRLAGVVDASVRFEHAVRFARLALGVGTNEGCAENPSTDVLRCAQLVIRVIGFA